MESVFGALHGAIKPRRRCKRNIIHAAPAPLEDGAPSAALDRPKAQAAPAPPGAPPPPRGGSPRPSPHRLRPLQSRGCGHFQLSRRAGWAAGSNTDPSFPFGVVQLAGDVNAKEPV